jgi:hypothetical protein
MGRGKVGLEGKAQGLKPLSIWRFYPRAKARGFYRSMLRIDSVPHILPHPVDEDLSTGARVLEPREENVWGTRGLSR